MNHFQNIDGIKIRFRQHQNPGKPQLLLTSAWPQSLRCWDLHWKALAKDYQLLAIDLPGYGLSEGRPELMSPLGQGKFLLKILSHFNIAKTHIIAPDVGVPISLWLAEEHSERLESLIIFNGPGFYPPLVSWEIKSLIRSPLARFIVAHTGRSFVKGSLKNGYKKVKISQDVREEYLNIYSDASRMKLTVQFLESYPRDLKIIGERLHSISVPTFILWGDQDIYLSVNNAFRLHQLIPNSHLHVLKGCGHFAHEDAGDIFLAQIDSWLKKEAQ